MPYDPNEDDQIKHGTLRQWLAYKVGNHNLRGWWIVAAVVLASFGLGKLF